MADVGKCVTHIDCPTIADLQRGWGFAPPQLPRNDRMPVTRPSRLRPLTRRSGARVSSLRILDRNALACPSGGWAKHWGRGGRSKTWDPLWSNGRSKLHVNVQTQADGLIVPYGTAVPWGPRIDAAKELDWLLATGPVHEPDAPHPLVPCQHGRDLATDLQYARAYGRGIGFSLDSVAFRDAAENGPTRQVTTATGTKVLTASGALVEPPLEAVQRQIDWERAESQKAPLVVKFSLKRSNQTGEPFVLYWAGWEVEPVYDQTGKLVKRGKPRRLSSSPSAVARRRAIEDRILAFGLTPEQAAANRADFVERAKAFGEQWQWSLAIDLWSKPDPRTMPAADGGSVTQDVPSEDDENAARFAELLAAHERCPQRMVDDFVVTLHIGCAAYGELDPETPSGKPPRWNFYEPDRTWFANHSEAFTSPSYDDLYIRS